MKLSSYECHLTHWGRVTHICVSRLTITGSDNGLAPGRRQAIIWTNAGILLIGPLGTNLSENLIEILTFSFTKMRLKVSSAKWRPFCLGFNELTDDKSTLFQVMAWYCQATSHYLRQCWPKSMSPFGITRPQCVSYNWSASYTHWMWPATWSILCVDRVYVGNMLAITRWFNVTANVYLFCCIIASPMFCVCGCLMMMSLICPCSPGIKITKGGRLSSLFFSNGNTFSGTLMGEISAGLGFFFLYSWNISVSLNILHFPI